MLHQVGVALYGSTATEESVSQRELVVRRRFASNLTPFVVPLLLTPPPPRTPYLPTPPAAHYAGATTGPTRPSRQKSTGTCEGLGGTGDNNVHFHGGCCVTFLCVSPQGVDPLRQQTGACVGDTGERQ